MRTSRSAANPAGIRHDAAGLPSSRIDASGATLSFSLRDGYDAASRWAKSLRVAIVGSSFGGLWTEVTHPGSTSHRQLSPKEREAAGIGDGLIRVAVGAEDPGDLVADFLRALEDA